MYYAVRRKDTCGRRSTTAGRAKRFPAWSYCGPLPVPPPGEQQDRKHIVRWLHFKRGRVHSSSFNGEGSQIPPPQKNRKKDRDAVKFVCLGYEMNYRGILFEDFGFKREDKDTKLPSWMHQLQREMEIPLHKDNGNFCHICSFLKNIPLPQIKERSLSGYVWLWQVISRWASHVFWVRSFGRGAWRGGWDFVGWMGSKI